VILSFTTYLLSRLIQRRFPSDYSQYKVSSLFDHKSSYDLFFTLYTSLSLLVFCCPFVDNMLK